MDRASASVFHDICFERRSVRGYLDKKVDDAILTEVFKCAQRTPSSCNTQPWKVHVVSGQRIQSLAEAFVASIEAGEYKPDFEHSMKYEGVYRDRQYDAAFQLYGAMGIKREDKEARHAAFLRNYRFFGAPHVAFLGMDEGFGLREAVDMGMYAQTLMLALTSHGIASCPQNALSFNGEFLRQQLDIDANWKVLMGLSFGYEDTEQVANQARVGRIAISDNISFHA